MPVSTTSSPPTAGSREAEAVAALGRGPAELRSLVPVKTLLSPAAKDVVDRNHRYHHILFNRDMFHNHLAHHVVAIEALGCEKLGDACSFENLWASYDRYIPKKPALREDVDVNAKSWKNWLGNKSCYSNYLKFFEDYLKGNSILQATVKYAFDPECIPRLVSGAVHPLIHLGYSVEAMDKQIAAEALAMTAIHSADLKPMVDLLDPNVNRSKLKAILDILKDIRADRCLDSVVRYTDEEKVSNTLAKATLFKEYVNHWTVEATEEDVVRKLSELHDAAVMILFASSRPGHPKSPQLDFFLMHVVTSSYSLRQLVPYLTLAHSAQLLRAHFATMVMFYVARGRPEITPSYLETYPIVGSWTDLASASFTHEDAHVPKVVHALRVFEDDYGIRGDKFRRGAQMVIDVLVKNKGDWNFKGMFDEMWSTRIYEEGSIAEKMYR